jgi:hypothetical protein
LNYNYHYYLLCTRAQDRQLPKDTHTEKHHVKPRCLGGEDIEDNYVLLTPEEHYLAHLLLVKMFPGVKGLIFAAHCMTGNPWGTRNNNKSYGWVRKAMAVAASETLKGRRKPEGFGAKVSKSQKGKIVPSSVGNKISIANKGKKRTPEQCKVQSAKLKGRPCSVATAAKIAESNRRTKAAKKLLLNTQEGTK